MKIENLKFEIEDGAGRKKSGTATCHPSHRDFMRQENKIRGNTRTVRRQYAARKWASVRVLPGIAGYCRVVGPGKKVDGRELMVESQNHARPHPSLLPQEKEPPAVACRTGSESRACFCTGKDSAGMSYRFVPAGTAWYRLVPDKIFSPDKKGRERCFGSGHRSLSTSSGRGANVPAFGRHPEGRDFHVFVPISQSEGFGFSPVMRFPGENFSGNGVGLFRAKNAPAYAGSYGGQAARIRRIATHNDG
jgi:hypothetical protein